jgi:hypothetical protein
LEDGGGGREKEGIVVELGLERGENGFEKGALIGRRGNFLNNWENELEQKKGKNRVAAAFVSTFFDEADIISDWRRSVKKIALELGLEALNARQEIGVESEFDILCGIVTVLDEYLSRLKNGG